MKLHLAACLLLGFQLVQAEVYNYGAGNAGGVNPGGPGPGFPQLPPNTGNMFNPTNPLGGSWTYQPTWSPSPAPWTPVTPPVSWTTQWASWTPITNQAPINSAVTGFQQLNGNCQGNYLGAVTQLTLDACAAACLGNPACAGFSFNLNSPYPQCILKNAVCSSPDPGATFTFFARNGVPPTDNIAVYPAAYVPAGPPVVVGVGAPYPPPPPPVAPVAPTYLSYGAVDPFGYLYRSPFWKSANVRQFKSTGAQYYELPGNCSGPILRGPFYDDLENCADQCSAKQQCTGFSYDNTTSSCVMHTGVCQTMKQSKKWTYFARHDSRRQHVHKGPVDEASDEAPLYQQPLPPMDNLENPVDLASNQVEAVEQQIISQMSMYNQRGYPPYRQSANRPYPAQLSSGRNYGYQYNNNPMDTLSRFEQLSGNCPGNAIGETMKLSLDECARLCLHTTACHGFSFNVSVNKPQDFQCMLKSKSCSEPSENSPYRFFKKRQFSGMPAYRYRHQPSSRT